MRLAREMVTIYYDQDAAQKAEENFTNTFKKGGVPDDIKEVSVVAGTILSDLLVQEGMIESKTEFKRLLKEGAITHVDSGEKIADDLFIKIEKDTVLKIGKRRFIKITIAS